MERRETMKVADPGAALRSRSWFASQRVPLLLVGVVVLAIGSFLAVWFCFGSSRLRARNLSAVQAGMPRAEVEVLLGGPSGDYGYFPDGVHESGDGSVVQLFAEPTAGPVTVENWLDDNNSITVFFDNERRVVAVSKARHFRRYAKGGVLEFLLRRIGTPPPTGPAPPKP
jgi:hypothetical protein